MTADEVIGPLNIAAARGLDQAGGGVHRAKIPPDGRTT